MKTHVTIQTAYAGYFSIRNTASGQLIAGTPAFTDGMTINKPRLYATPEAAEEAAVAVTWADCEAVQLVREENPCHAKN